MSYALVNLYKGLSQERDEISPSVGTGEIVAMLVSPYTLYCYWEINHSLFADMILTIYNKTQDISWEMEVRQKIGNVYIGITEKRGDDACDFQVSIGIKILPNKAVTPIAVSNIVSVPQIAPRKLLDQECFRL
jgi:hypothetical protein